MKRQAHPHFLVTLPTRAWFGLVSLFGATLLVCLLASAKNVKAQQHGWSSTASLSTGAFWTRSNFIGEWQSAGRRRAHDGRRDL